MNIPPFVLYGLMGCPNCASAENYIRKIGVPASLNICNGDPICAAGIEKITGKNEYPVLVYRPSKEIIVGFQPEAYERLARNFYSLHSSSVPSVFGGEEFTVTQAPQQAEAAGKPNGVA